MRVTVLDIRKVFPKKEADAIRNKFSQMGARVVTGSKIVYVPTQRHSGGEIRQQLNVFDLDIIQEIYERKLANPRYNHIHNKLVATMQQIHKIRSHLEGQRRSN